MDTGSPSLGGHELVLERDHFPGNADGSGSYYSILMVVFAKTPRRKISDKKWQLLLGGDGKAGLYVCLSMGVGAADHQCVSEKSGSTQHGRMKWWKELVPLISKRRIILSRRDTPVHPLPARWCCTGSYRKNTVYRQCSWRR